MKKGLILSVLLTLASSALMAQVPDALKRDSKITVGDLPNGTSYYIVSNPVTKGFADIALIQKSFLNEKASRQALSHLDNFGARIPYRFLADNGIGYSENGFISYRDGSTVFSFRDVPMFDESSSDSTLLVLFNIMKTCPTRQAVVISGDVSVSKIMDRLYMLSMTVGKLAQPAESEPYEWRPDTIPSVRVLNSPHNSVAQVSVKWSMPRTPADMMGTLQPLVSEMLSDEMTTVLKRRVRAGFEEAGVPLARMDSRKIDSGSTAGDEIFEFTVFTSPSETDRAVRILAGTFSSLDAKGATAAEYQDAKDRRISLAQKASGESAETNAYYVERCISSYLYGASLASSSSVAGFFSKRRLSSDKEVSLFNNYISSIFDPSRALSLTVRTNNPDLREDAILAAFREEWDAAATDTTRRIDVQASYSDTLALTIPKARVRIKTEGTEPIIGASLWTFSNGIRVIYKRTEGAGQFNYAMMMRGGLTGVPGLKNGEAPFVADMLRISSVAGMSGASFRAMLRANGINFGAAASLSDLRIVGSAPKGKLELVMKALVAMSSAKPADAATLNVFLRDEQVRVAAERHSLSGVDAIADSLLSPTFKYNSGKNTTNVRPDLPTRAGKYFSNLYSKVNDGIFIITGDFDDYTLQKVLSRYLGGFKTSKTIAFRPHIPRAVRPGWGTVSGVAAESAVGNGRPVVEMVIPLPGPVSTDSYMTFKVAEEVARRSVVKAVAAAGMCASVTTDVECFPTEMLVLRIVCTPCEESGLPEGVSPRSVQKARDAIRFALQSASALDMDISGYKTVMKNRIASNLSNPEHALEALMFRYSNSKDIISHYSSSLDGVTSEKVSETLRKLSSSSARAECILY